MPPQKPAPAGSSLAGLMLGMVAFALATIQLPGKNGGRLAVCTQPGCRWWRFLPGAASGVHCTSHGLARRRFVRSDEVVSLKCPVRGCPDDSPAVAYRPGSHGPRNFHCMAHGGGG
jgi:hypothetical protein